MNLYIQTRFLGAYLLYLVKYEAGPEITSNQIKMCLPEEHHKGRYPNAQPLFQPKPCLVNLLQVGLYFNYSLITLDSTLGYGNQKGGNPETSWQKPIPTLLMKENLS